MATEPSKLNRTTIVVSRKWDRPDIEAFVNFERVGASINVRDFVAALAAEVGNPIGVLTQGQLERRMQAAAAVILEELKSSTKFVV